MALASQSVLDGTNPIENQFVNFFDDMKDTELMLQPSPVTLQSILVKGRPIRDGNRHQQTPILKTL